MPGKQSHQIILQTQLSDLEKISFPPVPIFDNILNEISQQLQKSTQNLEKQLDWVIPELAELSKTLQRAQLAEKGSIITGTLDNSIRKLSSNKNNAEIGTGLFYASYVELGRGPVKPKNKKYLAFKSPGYGWVITKSVKAAKPRYYLKDSSTQLGKEIDETLNTIMRAFI